TTSPQGEIAMAGRIERAQPTAPEFRTNKLARSSAGGLLFWLGLPAVSPCFPISRQSTRESRRRFSVNLLTRFESGHLQFAPTLLDHPIENSRFEKLKLSRVLIGNRVLEHKQVMIISQ